MIRKGDRVVNASSTMLMRVDEINREKALCSWSIGNVYNGGPDGAQRRMNAWFPLADLTAPPNPMLLPAAGGQDGPAQGDAK